MSGLLDSYNEIFTNGIELIFYVAVLIFTIYSVFLAYHWYSYGTKKSIATLAMAVYLGVSAVLFITMTLALMYI